MSGDELQTVWAELLPGGAGGRLERVGTGRVVLAVDPSSTCTGYAVFDGATLREAGRLRPRSEEGAMVRIATLCADLAELLAAVGPAVVVIETTSGKVAGRLRRQGVSGLAVYGMAVGALWREAVFWAQVKPERSVALVAENVWTAGVPKGRRLALAARLYPQYQGERDKGGDAGDAIMLGRWWIERNSGAEAVRCDEV